MILAACKYMLRPFLKTLRSQGIPFCNPYRPQDGAWNPMRGGARRVANFLRIYRDDVEHSDSSTWTWSELWSWIEFVDAKRAGLTRGAKARVKERAGNPSHSEDLVTPAEAREIFTDEEFLGDLADLDVVGEDAAVEWFKSVILDARAEYFKFAFEVYRTGGAFSLVETPSVIVGTIHSCKGAEADTVIICPDISRRAFEALEGDEGRASTRLLYVGITRTRDELIFCRPVSDEHAILMEDE